MPSTHDSHDPLRRRVGVVVFLTTVVAVVAGRVDLLAGLLTAAGGAVLLGWLLSRQLAPLRRRVVGLSGIDLDAPTPVEMAELIERASEREIEQRAALRVERDDLVDVLRAIANGILLLDGEDRVLVVNDAARRLLSSTADPLGRRLPEVTRNVELLQLVAAVRAGENPDPRRIEVHAGGGLRSLRVWVARLSSRTRDQRVVVVLDDISDVQHLERVRTDFVANVTHEMRSPLSAIVGFAETLAEESERFTDLGRRAIGRILANSQRLGEIIDDLVRLSRLENAVGTQRAQVELPSLIERVVAPFRDLCADKHQTFELAVAPDVGTAPVDESLLTQALTNLLDNAVKYTPEKGRVAVEVRVEGATLHVDVVDDGPGIPREHQERIFERFYRVDSARSRAVGGSGLGLSIVKHAAALHGGQVVLDSEVGRGTRFSLQIPLEETP
jgi:two-component system phosphate regulon sensor histidine kinase PhoR